MKRFRLELGAVGLELTAVARKERHSAEQRGRSELQGILMVAGAVLLFLALVSYDRHDLDFNRVPANENIHNLLGRVGARVAWSLFFVFGAAAYLPPVLLLAFGCAAFVPSLAEIRKSGRTVAGTFGLLITAVGGLDLFDTALGGLRTHIDSMWVGGIFGRVLNERITIYLFNRTGATLIYLALYLVSLYWLTGFHALEWVRQFLADRAAARAETEEGRRELLERQRSELESKARKLQQQLSASKTSGAEADDAEDEVDAGIAPAKRSRKAAAENAEKRAETEPGEDEDAEEKPSGLGPDLKPVPEPTFRDNSVAKVRPPAAKVFEGDNPFAPKPAEPAAGTPSKSTPVGEGETISAQEVAANTSPTDIVLGRKSNLRKSDRAEKPAEPVEAVADVVAPVDPDPASLPPWDVDAGATGDAAAGAGGTGPSTGANGASAPMPPMAPPRPRPMPRRPKPIMVASTPIIGNYQLPSLDLLNMPDYSVRPTETKEELMANSRLIM